MNNTCVCCGDIIPEGHFVCPACMAKYKSRTENPYWEKITRIAERQRNKGISTYGAGIECNLADVSVRIDMLEEELVDALMYLEWLRDGLREVSCE